MTKVKNNVTLSLLNLIQHNEKTNVKHEFETHIVSNIITKFIAIRPSGRLVFVTKSALQYCYLSQRLAPLITIITIV